MFERAVQPPCRHHPVKPMKSAANEECSVCVCLFVSVWDHSVMYGHARRASDASERTSPCRLWFSCFPRASADLMTNRHILGRDRESSRSTDSALLLVSALPRCVWVCHKGNNGKQVPPLPAGYSHWHMARTRLWLNTGNADVHLFAKAAFQCSSTLRKHELCVLVCSSGATSGFNEGLNLN